MEIYRRAETDWVHEIHTEGPIRLDCLDMHLSIETIYEDIEATPGASC